MSVSKLKQNIVAPFASGPFEPHGRIEHWLEGNVLCFEATGPFNVEAIEALGRSREQWLPAAGFTGLFANIAEFRNSVLVTPEGFEAFRRYLGGRTSSATAFVIAPDVEGASTMVPLFEREFASLGHPFAAFETRVAAEVWVRATLVRLAQEQDLGKTA